MSDYRTLSQLTGLSVPVLQRLVSNGQLHTDDPERRKGVERPFTVGDGMRACLMAALARIGVGYADAGRLVAPLAWKDGFTYAGKPCGPDPVLAVWTENADRDERPLNQQPVRYEAALLPRETCLNMLARPAIEGLVVLPLARHWHQLLALSEARRAKARTPEQNGWAAVMEKRKP